MADASLQIVITAKDEAAKVLKGIGSEADSLGSKLKSVAAPLAGLVAGFLSFKTLESAVSTTAELGGEIRQLARETGLAAEDASRFIFVAKELGLGADDLSRSFGIFAKNLINTRDSIQQGKDATTPFANSLKSLGVNMRDSNGTFRDGLAVFKDLADRFKTLPDGPEKTARAIDIFGRSGKDMIPILNKGSEGIAELAKEADKLGLTFSAENLEKTRQYTMAQREFGEAVAGLKVSIGLEVMPVLTRFSQWFTDHQEEVRSFIHDAFDVGSSFAKDFVSGLDTIKDALSWIPDNKGEIIAAVAAIGVAMVLAFGPESAAVAGIVALVAALGQIKQNGIDLGPLGKLGGQAKGPSDLAQLYAAKSLLETGDVPQGQREALKAYNNNHQLPNSIADINTRIAQLEAGTTGGQPKKEVVEQQQRYGQALDDGGKAARKAADDAERYASALDSFRQAMGSAVQSFLNLSNIKNAVSALFANPTREQADLTLAKDEEALRKLKYGDKSVHFGAGEGPGTAAKSEKQLSLLDQEHKVQQDRITAANNLLLTEGQLNQEATGLRDLMSAQSTLIREKLNPAVTDLVPELSTAYTGFSSLNDILNGPQSVVANLLTFSQNLAAFKLPTFKDPNSNGSGPDQSQLGTATFGPAF